MVEGDRLIMANGVLPLTERKEVPPHYGTRHRAAMGLAERCDALVVVVSEERGEVTLMDGRVMRRMDNAEELVQILQKLESRSQASWRTRAWRVFSAHLGFKSAALGLAGLVWGMTFLVTGTTVRTVSIPVEIQQRAAGDGNCQSIDRYTRYPVARQFLAHGLGEPGAAGGAFRSTACPAGSVDTADHAGNREPAAGTRYPEGFAGRIGDPAGEEDEVESDTTSGLLAPFPGRARSLGSYPHQLPDVRCHIVAHHHP